MRLVNTGICINCGDGEPIPSHMNQIAIWYRCRQCGEGQVWHLPKAVTDPQQAATIISRIDYALSYGFSRTGAAIAIREAALAYLTKAVHVYMPGHDKSVIQEWILEIPFDDLEASPPEEIARIIGRNHASR